MENSEELISIIIPVYKVEKYLNRCLDSVVNQTYKNLEIILVDDGSPDNCPKICDEYAKNDRRVIVIHKENGGQSTARNAGLDICSGEYIAFIDSDDYVSLDYIEKLYSATKENNSQITICPAYYFNENGKIWKSDKLEKKVISGDERLDYAYLYLCYYFIVPWGKIYHKSIWQNLRYPNLKISEDLFVSDITFRNAERICFIEDYLYYYFFERSDSSLGLSSKKGNRSALDFIKASKERLNRLEADSKYRDCVIIQLFESYFITYKRVKSDKKLRNEVKKDFIENYKKYKKCNMSFKKRVKYYLFMYCSIVLKLLKRI